MSETCTGHALPLSCVRACTKLTQPSYVRTCAMHIQALLCLLAVLAHASDVQATLCLSAVFVHARCKYRQCSYRCDTRTGHDLPYSCVRTCAMHAQATLCLTAVFVHARCMYRPRSALQLCSYLRDACTGRALPYSCVRTCAVHVRATLCLAAVFVHARCMYGPRSAFQLCSHMRGMRGPRSARRMQGVCCTRMASPLAHENAHVAADTRKRTWRRY